GCSPARPPALLKNQGLQPNNEGGTSERLQNRAREEHSWSSRPRVVLAVTERGQLERYVFSRGLTDPRLLDHESFASPPFRVNGRGVASGGRPVGGVLDRVSASRIAVLSLRLAFLGVVACAFALAGGVSTGAATSQPSSGSFRLL